MICSVYEIIASTIFIAIIIGILLYAISYFFIYKDYSYEKVSIYECGFDPFSDISIPFEVHYYLISILFIIFDIEISFMFPLSTSFFFIGFYGLISVILFLVILTIGFFYELVNKALELK